MRLLSLFACTLLAPALLAQDPKTADPNDQYKLGPDSQPQPGVPQGKVTAYDWNDSKIYPGSQHKYWLYVPAQYDAAKPACLMVFQDGGGYQSRGGAWRVPVVFDNLIAKKEMPVTVGLFISPGVKPPPAGQPTKTADGKPVGSMRSIEYNSLNDTYARFLIEEILPEVRKTVKISPDPERRGIGGSSSGAICAFTVAWERPDQFRKVFSTIGSYTNIRGGGAYPELVRKAPKKPIRIFQQDGSNDLVNQFGSWPEANKAMDAAFTEKGYDHKFVFGEGTHNPKHGASLLPDAMRWLFRDVK